jgi:hypothetical protein
LGMTALGALFLALHEHFGVARRVIPCLLGIYSILLLYHVFLACLHW